jgi:DNA ligase (NAD+)
VDDLVAIKDIGPKVAESVVAFFQRPEIRTEITALRAHGVDLDVHDEDRPVDVAAAADSPLKGKTVVITGAFTDPRSGAKVSRPEVTRMVEQAAASTASSVSGETDYLLAGANVGASKTAKAEKLGVAVIDQDELWRWLAEAGVA